MDIYKKLGIKKLMSPFTTLGGSLLPTEVVAAMGKAAESFVDVKELLVKAGAQIAELAVPAAFITAVAAAGIAIPTQSSKGKKATGYCRYGKRSNRI